MKSLLGKGHVLPGGVAPRTGAWIEMVYAEYTSDYTGASPPARGRGLKLNVHGQMKISMSRPPHGGVD